MSNHLRRQLNDLTDEIFYMSLSEQAKSLLDQAGRWFIDLESQTLVFRCDTPRQAKKLWEKCYTLSVNAQKTGIVENFSVYVGDRFIPYYDWDIKTANLLYESRLKQVLFSEKSKNLLSQADEWRIDHINGTTTIKCSSSDLARQILDHADILSLDAQESGLIQKFLIYVQGTEQPFCDWDIPTGIMMRGIKRYEQRLRDEEQNP